MHAPAAFPTNNTYIINEAGLNIDAVEKNPDTKALRSKQILGDDIHKYYCKASITDGYTLHLIREKIAISSKMILQQAL